MENLERLEGQPLQNGQNGQVDAPNGALSNGAQSIDAGSSTAGTHTHVRGGAIPTSPQTNGMRFCDG